MSAQQFRVHFIFTHAIALLLPHIFLSHASFHTQGSEQEISVRCQGTKFVALIQPLHSTATHLCPCYPAIDMYANV